MPSRALVLALALLAPLCGGVPAHASMPLHADDFRGGAEVAVAPADAPRTAALRTAATGQRSIGVILVNFADDASEPWTPEEVEQRVLTGAGSMSAFFAEDSHGRLTFTGDVLGWYRLATGSAGCDLQAITDGARAAATADGADLSAFDHLMFVFPPVADCWWSGQAHVGGPWSWINGTMDVHVLAHEIGHNLGVHHAAGYACEAGGVPVTISSQCTVREYDDPHSVMGGWELRHNHAWHLEQLGFVPASKVQTVTESGTYALRAAADPEASPVALRIPRTLDSTGRPLDYYVLDLRTPWGAIDDWSPGDAILGGVSIRLVPDPAVVRQSYLLDTTPGTSAWPNGFADGALAPGRTFAENEVSVTTVSVESGEATVAVVLGPPAEEEQETPAEPEPEPVEEDTGATAEPEPTAAPDLAEPEPDDAAPPAVAPPAPAPVLPAGTVAPLAISDARPHARVRARRTGRRVRVVALATDDRSVVRLELWVDGRRRRTAASGRLVWSGRLRRARGRRHVVVVRAFDASGQRDRARARVR